MCARSSAPASDDEALRVMMAAAADGDSAAFEALVEALSGRVMRYLQRAGVPHAEAEELVQETWIRVYRNRGCYRRGRPVGAWVFRIARNLMIDRARQLRPTVPFESEAIAVGNGIAASGVEEADEARYLWRQIREAVAPVVFDMLWLHYGEGLPVREVARILEVTTVNVRVQMHRARRHLARVMRWRGLP
jgi:RNA polymerase sigma-70 factor, ECF subfamily